MTAKEKLRQAIDDLSESEAEEALVFVSEKVRHDPVIELFEAAREDDEPSAPDEDASAKEAWEAHEQGGSVPLEEVRRELG